MDALALRERAEELYRSGQFLCSEAIVCTFNEATDVGLGLPRPR
jgi:hypothetical protein